MFIYSLVSNHANYCTAFMNIDDVPNSLISSCKAVTIAKNMYTIPLLGVHGITPLDDVEVYQRVQ